MEIFEEKTDFAILPYSIDYDSGFIALGLDLGFGVLTKELYQSRSWWSPTQRNADKQQVLFSVVGRAKGQPEGIERSKVRAGSGKLAGGRPQRNTERRTVSLVLQWARWRAGPEGSDCAVVGWLVG